MNASRQQHPKRRIAKQDRREFDRSRDTLGRFQKEMANRKNLGREEAPSVKRHPDRA